MFGKGRSKVFLRQPTERVTDPGARETLIHVGGGPCARVLSATAPPLVCDRVSAPPETLFLTLLMTESHRRTQWTVCGGFCGVRPNFWQ